MDYIISNIKLDVLMEMIHMKHGLYTGNILGNVVYT